MATASEDLGSDDQGLVVAHQRAGWLALVVFVALGLVLEALHGFKVGGYLDVSNSTRRLLLTLSHAHGTLLGLVHIAFASTAARTADADPPSPTWRWASRCLNAATILLPGGFLLGGLFIHQGDPGIGALLVPIGGVVLLASMVLTLRGVRRPG